MPRDGFPTEPAVVLEEFKGLGFVPLDQRNAPEHVGEHDGDESAMMGAVFHSGSYSSAGREDSWAFKAEGVGKVGGRVGYSIPNGLCRFMWRSLRIGGGGDRGIVEKTRFRSLGGQGGGWGIWRFIEGGALAPILPFPPNLSRTKAEADRRCAAGAGESSVSERTSVTLPPRCAGGRLFPSSRLTSGYICSHFLASIVATP